MYGGILYTYQNAFVLSALILHIPLINTALTLSPEVSS
jgi:hypothetical protein